MTIAPTKYMPLEYSLLGLAAAVLEAIGGSESISALWDKVRADEKVRTFDRFAEALTILFTVGVIRLEGGLIVRTTRPAQP